MAFGPRKVISWRDATRSSKPGRGRRAHPHDCGAAEHSAHPGFRTPCAKTGVCSDCNSPDRVCNTRMEMLRCWPDKGAGGAD
ncbi:MAG: hypothetical protein ACLRMJ_00825 [Alistipes finegoldii]